MKYNYAVFIGVLGTCCCLAGLTLADYLPNALIVIFVVGAIAAIIGAEFERPE